MNDRLPHEKGFHISWDQLHRDSRALAWRLDGQGPDNGAWRAVVAITRGGMVPACIMARELEILTIETFCITSYNVKDQSETKVLKSPDFVDNDGEGWLVIDDLVDTANTLCEAAHALKEHGAKTVLAYSTHAVLSGKAIERITHSELDKLIVTDTIPLSDEAKNCSKIK